MKYFGFLILGLMTVALRATPAYSQPNVHPAFTALSAQQVRSEFEDYEAKGARCAQDRNRGRTCAVVNLSPEQPLNIPVQSLRGVELLTFRVSISTPRAQIRWMGYQFGILGRQRTPADREDSLRRLIARMQEAPKTINFTFKLISRGDWETPLPGLTFALQNTDQRKVWSSSRPGFECPERDWICQVGLKESGQSVAFPLFTTAPADPRAQAPFVNDSMRTVKLLVTVDESEEPIEFDLRTL